MLLVERANRSRIPSLLDHILMLYQCAAVRDLDRPHGEERELDVDRDRVYELDGETAARLL